MKGSWKVWDKDWGEEGMSADTLPDTLGYRLDHNICHKPEKIGPTLCRQSSSSVTQPLGDGGKNIWPALCLSASGNETQWKEGRDLEDHSGEELEEVESFAYLGTVVDNRHWKLRLVRHKQHSICWKKYGTPEKSAHWSRYVCLTHWLPDLFWTLWRFSV